MQTIIGQAALWLAVAAEIAIWAFVARVIYKQCIPWDDIRAKRALRRMLRERVPVLRERVRRLAARTRHPVRRCRARWARELGDAMTRDAGRLLSLSTASIDSVARHLGYDPRSASVIERHVTATIDCVEKMLVLRDERLPEIAAEKTAMAREVLADLEKLRAAVAARVEECADEGANVAHERRCIALLANAFAAHAAAAEDDPDETFRLVPVWTARMREVAESAELRAMLAKRLDEVEDEMTVRAARARRLYVRARPFLALLRVDPRLQGTAGRLASIASAGRSIEEAEGKLAAARAVASEEGTDLGMKGGSAKRLTEALLTAERALSALVMLEEALLVAVTAFDAGGGSRDN